MKDLSVVIGSEGLRVKMFKKKEKQYKLTKEVQYKYIKYTSFWKLRNTYIDEENTKLAKLYAIESEVCRVKFWESVHELYPELKGENLKYTLEGNYITDRSA